MFFVSTPSLIISLVLALFYLANLAFLAVNRQQETENAVGSTIVLSAVGRFPEQTVFFDCKSNVRQHKAGCDMQPENFPGLHFLCQPASDRDCFRQTLPDNHQPVTSDSGIYQKLFFRPPPVC